MQYMAKREYERIADFIRYELSNKPYKTGDKFISERELAEQCGCSRVTIRTALEKIEREGLLARVPGKGTFVLDKLTRLESTSPPAITMISLLIFNAPKAGHYGWFIKGFCEGIKNKPITLFPYFLDSGIDDEFSLPDYLDRCAGYIIAGDYTQKDISKFLVKRKPMVVIGMAEDELLRNIGGSYVQVCWDHRTCYRRGVELLLEYGYRQPAIIVGSYHSAYRERIEGFLDGLAQLGIEADNTNIFILHPEQTGGISGAKENESIMEKILYGHNEFDSIITCVKEELLGAVLRKKGTLHKYGLLLETGYPDDLVEACGISEMRLDHCAAGRLAAQKMIQQLNDRKQLQQRITVPIEMIIHKSSLISNNQIND